VGAKKAKGAGVRLAPFFERRCMKLSFYRAEAVYCDFLRRTDACVPYTYDKKETRPFVGILLTVAGLDYYAPLTSPKPKHQKMKNQVDFLKINRGIWGAINFNNMIPIYQQCLTPVELHILPTDLKSDIDYKNLLANQLSWCNANKEQIMRQAAKLYLIISSGKTRTELARRCCDFRVDEQQYHAYGELQGFTALRRTSTTVRPGC
jgi:protein AbiQ